MRLDWVQDTPGVPKWHVNIPTWTVMQDEKPEETQVRVAEIEYRLQGKFRHKWVINILGKPVGLLDGDITENHDVMNLAENMLEVTIGLLSTKLN